MTSNKLCCCVNPKCKKVCMPLESSEIDTEEREDEGQFHLVRYCSNCRREIVWFNEIELEDLKKNILVEKLK